MLKGRELFMKEIDSDIGSLRNLLNKLTYNSAHKLDLIKLFEDKIKSLEEFKDIAEPYDGDWAITLKNFKDGANKIRVAIEAILSNT